MHSLASEFVADILTVAGQLLTTAAQHIAHLSNSRDSASLENNRLSAPIVLQV